METSNFPERANKMASIKKFLTDESGLELSEYVIATALITLTLIAAFNTLSDRITSVFNEVIAWLNS